MSRYGLTLAMCPQAECIFEVVGPVRATTIHFMLARGASGFRYFFFFLNLPHNAVNARSQRLMHRKCNTINYSYQINVSSICIKRYTCKLNEYFNYVQIVGLCKYVFIAQVWFSGMGQLIFWGPVSFFGGPVSFFGGQ